MLNKDIAIFSLNTALKWLIICLLVGLAVGTASAWFLKSLAWVTNFREKHVWLILFLPFAGYAIGWVYHKYGKNVVGGNTLILDNIQHPKQQIPLKISVFIYLSTLTTHLFGGSAGREGTALQMAAGIADQLTKPFKLSSQERKILLIVAVAAGFSSVFGTPIAGAIFAIEFSRRSGLNYAALIVALIAAFFANYITHLWAAEHTMYTVASLQKISFHLLFYTILAGIIFGLCAIIFIKSLQQTSTLFKNKVAYPPLRPFFGGIIVVAAVLLLGTTKYIGLGIPTILSSFTHSLPPQVFLIKILLTVITIGAGFKGGEVTPLFFIGATLGSALAVFLPIPVDVLAAMGFVAVFAGATNTPLACAVMGVELFGLHTGVLMLLVCFVSFLFSSNSTIYKQKGKSTFKWLNFRFK